MRLILLLAPFAMLFAQNRSVPVDNEFVRVLSVVDQPVAKPGTLHEHKENRVMIYLDSGDIQIKYSNGTVDNQHWKAGDVAWSPANGMHTSQNVSAKPIRIVEIEVRSKGLAGTKAPSGKVLLEKALLENDQVKVYRTTEAIHAQNYLAVNQTTAEVLWNRMPAGPGPFLIAEIK